MSENPVGRSFVAIETKLLLQAVKFIEAGRVDEANVLCDEAIAVAPESGEAWYVKGILSERRGEMANAVSAHENAVSFDAGSERNNISLVGMLAKVGRVADAIVIVEQLLEKAPERADLRTILSGLKLTSARLCWRGIGSPSSDRSGLLYTRSAPQLGPDIVPNVTYGRSACGMQRRHCGG